MIRLPPLQSVRFDFSGLRACEPVTGSPEFSGSRACDSATGSGESGVAALTGCAWSGRAGCEAGVNTERSLFQSGTFDDSDDAMAISGYCTTAKLRMTSHRPMIYPHLLPSIPGTHWCGPQSYRNAANRTLTGIAIGLGGSVFRLSATIDTRQTRRLKSSR